MSMTNRLMKHLVLLAIASHCLMATPALADEAADPSSNQTLDRLTKIVALQATQIAELKANMQELYEATKPAGTVFDGNETYLRAKIGQVFHYYGTTNLNDNQRGVFVGYFAVRCNLGDNCDHINDVVLTNKSLLTNSGWSNFSVTLMSFDNTTKTASLKISGHGSKARLVALPE